MEVLNFFRRYLARRYAKRQLAEARKNFSAAAGALVEANRAARASGQRYTQEMEAAAVNLNSEQQRLEEAEADFERVAGGPKPVPLTERVARKVQVLFPPDQQEEVIRLLDKECGHSLPLMEKAEPQGLDQVRLAVLKMADGSLAGLRQQIDMAKRDWRDVIGPAETPEAMSFGLVNLIKADATMRHEINERDRQQYTAWLNEEQPVC